MYLYVLIKKLPPYTLDGFDLTTHTLPTEIKPIPRPRRQGCMYWLESKVKIDNYWDAESSFDGKYL
jgi:hypothetical protein